MRVIGGGNGGHWENNWPGVSQWQTLSHNVSQLSKIRYCGITLSKAEKTEETLFFF